jgi:RNA-directed DNA polymerase
VLDGLETKLRKRFANKRLSQNVNIIRYADDFVITGKTKELLENEVKPMVEMHLKERALELSPEKTKVTHIESGFDSSVMELSQVQRQIDNQTVEKECSGFPNQNPRLDRFKQADQNGQFDSSTQSDYSRMGKLSSPRGQ